MKLLLLLPFAWFTLVFARSHDLSSVFMQAATVDSGTIMHKLDGMVDEWTADKFSSDNETGIQYAIDNNGNNLFLALNIPDFRMQVKLMRMGMKMFIDGKAKKKESNGIEFPIKNGNADLSNKALAGARQPRQNADKISAEQQRKQDMKAIRKLLAMNLAVIKIFGMSDKYPDGQQLMLPGSANIAFSWDSTDVMHIEYLIPLSLLGDISSLHQKEISIGWKINAFEMPKESEGSEGGQGSESFMMENRNSPMGGYGGRSGDPNYGGQGGNMMADQRFWTKYMIRLQSEKKAF